MKKTKSSKMYVINVCTINSFVKALNEIEEIVVYRDVFYYYLQKLLTYLKVEGHD